MTCLRNVISLTSYDLIKMFFEHNGVQSVPKSFSKEKKIFDCEKWFYGGFPTLPPYFGQNLTFTGPARNIFFFFQIKKVFLVVKFDPSNLLKS